MIEIKNLSFAYPNQALKVTLNQISLDMAQGKITVLMGPSGCGKSTLLRVLMGLESQASGSLKVDSQSFNFVDWNQSQTAFGLVPQTPHLLPWKTIKENIELAVPQAFSKDLKIQKVEQVLDIVELAKDAAKYPWQVSVGMASRVSFARTLVMERPVILFDEPFAAIDSVTRRKLQDWLRAIVKEHSIATLFVTHDLQEAKYLGDEVFVMNLDGKIAAHFDNQNLSIEDLYQCLKIAVSLEETRLN